MRKNLTATRKANPKQDGHVMLEMIASMAFFALSLVFWTIACLLSMP